MLQILHGGMQLCTKEIIINLPSTLEHKIKYVEKVFTDEKCIFPTRYDQGHLE